MSCLKGQSCVKKKEAKFTCSKCDACTNKKGDLCKPEKLKPKKDFKNSKKHKGKSKK